MARLSGIIDCDFNFQTSCHSTQKAWYSCAVQNWKKVSPYWCCCAWGQKDWVERKGKGSQLQWSKTGSEKELELVLNFSQVLVAPVVIGD